MSEIFLLKFIVKSSLYKLKSLKVKNIKFIIESFIIKKILLGVGRSTTMKLHTMDIKTCGDLQQMDQSKLQHEFGSKVGKTLHQHCRGIDDRPLVYEHERKSVSSEVNYGIRFKDNIEAEKFIKQLTEEVHTRLTEVKMKGKSITLKLMVRSRDAPEESSKFMGHGVCDYVTKSSTLSTATADLNTITREIFSIYNKLNHPPSELRGIGIQISKLEKIKPEAANTLIKFLKPAPVKPKVDMMKPLQITIPRIKLTSAEEDDEDHDPEIDYDDFSNLTSSGNACSKEVKDKLKSVILARNLKIATNEKRSKVSLQLNTETTRSVVENVKKVESTVTKMVSNGTKTLGKIGKGRGRPKGTGSKISKTVENNMSLYSFLKPQNEIEVRM